MKMSPVTRMMVMSDRYKKSSNGERQQGGRQQMEQPRYNEDYVGRKARDLGDPCGATSPLSLSTASLSALALPVGREVAPVPRSTCWLRPAGPWAPGRGRAEQSALGRKGRGCCAERRSPLRQRG